MRIIRGTHNYEYVAINVNLYCIRHLLVLRECAPIGVVDQKAEWVVRDFC